MSRSNRRPERGRRPGTGSRRQSSGSPLSPLFLIMFGGLVLIGIGLAVFYNDIGLSQQQSAAVATKAAAPVPADPNIPFPEVPRVALAEAKTLAENKTVLMVDVRAETDFKDGHITGALNVPWDQIEARLSELPKDREIITYCT